MSIATLVVLVALGAGALALRGSFVTPAEARRLVGGGALLLDVRSRAEFDGGHLPGAINVPVDELATRLPEVGPTGRSIVTYCASGVRSARAGRILRQAGFRSVHNLGGMSRWWRPSS